MNRRPKNEGNERDVGERSEPTTGAGQLPLPLRLRVQRPRWSNAWAFRRHEGYYVGLGGWHCVRCGCTFERILDAPTCRASFTFRTDVWWGRFPRYGAQVWESA